MTKKDVIEIYSTHSEVKSVVAERITRILKNKIYKYMTLISKNVYIDKLDDIVNRYNNAYHKIIKIIKYHKIIIIKIDVKPSKYIDFNKDNDMVGLNLKLVIILEYQDIKILLQKAMF